MTIPAWTAPRAAEADTATPRAAQTADGQGPPPGIPLGVAGVASSKIRLPGAPQRPVVGEADGERIVGRNGPVAEGRVVVLPLHP